MDWILWLQLIGTALCPPGVAGPVFPATAPWAVVERFPSAEHCEIGLARRQAAALVHEESGCTISLRWKLWCEDTHAPDPATLKPAPQTLPQQGQESR